MQILYIMINTCQHFISCLILVLTLYSCQQENITTVKTTTEKKLFSLVDKNHSNLIFINQVKQTKENNHMINSAFISGGGVAVADINNDGLQDVFFTGNQVQDKLFLNKGDLTFEDITSKAGITKDANWSSGVTFVDIDNDGDQDIYVCRFTYLENDKSANQLYINNGDLTFTEKAEAFGLADKGFSIQANFFDFDNDGLLDVYVVNQPPSIPNLGYKLNFNQFSDILFSDRLYRNTGNGKFVDYTEAANVRNFGFGLSASTSDLNNDGWQDIYVTNDFDAPDHMYINQQNGTFKNVIDQSTKHISNFSMGSDIADYDNDGNTDLIVLDMMADDHKRIKTNMGSMKPEVFWQAVNDGKHYQYMFNTLQRNNGNGTFSDIAQLAGVSSTDWSWTPLLADFNNDGYKDLFVTNGVKSNNRNSDLVSAYEKKLDSIRKLARQKGLNPNTMINVMDFVDLAPTDKLSNFIYKNNGDLTFTDKTNDWGIKIPTLSNGAAYADFDNDGDLDLIMNNIDENAMLFKNNTVESGEGNFLRFHITSSDHNPLYGTKITLQKDNKLWQVAELENARGYMSKSENLVHFGVGDHTKIEKAIIQWNDGSETALQNLNINQVLEIDKSNIDAKSKLANSSNKPLFKDISNPLGIGEIAHQENEYDDYSRELLLPHKMSQFGPSIAVGDVNGDGREDFFMGGAAGFSGRLFIQNTKGKFDTTSKGPWNQDKASEDMGIALVDIDNDNDLDLFVVSGGNEFEPTDKALQDRLYINNGNGVFTEKMNAVPNYLTSGSCVIPTDFDADGDIDLFIGGRLIPGKYPHSPDSHLLENRNGSFVDISKEKAPDLMNLGMVTSASWTDYNKDGKKDLIVVGEWMPITLFTQTTAGKFKKTTIKDSEGWYYSIKTNDMDNDGDDDFIVGNLGLNYKYKASKEEPFEVYCDDFDGNGKLDIVLSYYEHGISFPVRGRSCSSEQIPSLKEKFPSYEEFGNSNLTNIYGESLKTAFNLKAKTFSSAYIENLGGGKFNIKPLPKIAQISSINDILIDDYDNDGNKDLLISGNLYTSEIETPRNDAGTGLFLKGNGKGRFTPVSIKESGFFTPNDVKDLKKIQIGDKQIILVANNNDYLQAIEYISTAIN